VLGLCRALGAAKWGAALGVLLVDTELLTPFAAAHPEAWADFVGRLEAEPRLSFMGELVGALSLLPEAGSSGGGAGSGGGTAGGEAAAGAGAPLA
jgi:hypothetical protein